MTTGGFPHSDIPGSQPVDDSPGLFAGDHVLHRRNAPRHPPYALLRLDSYLLFWYLYSVHGLITGLPRSTSRTDCAALLRLLSSSPWRSRDPTDSSVLSRPLAGCSGCQRTASLVLCLCCARYHGSRACTDRSPLMETSGFEPLTPCLQGRCSPS